MTTMVCFRAGDTAYCLPVEAARGVRTAVDLMALPQQRTGVAGMIPGDPPMTVVSSLGGGGSHILVIETPTKVFGLLVDAVTSVSQVDGKEIGPAPDGQSRQLVSGTVDQNGELLLVADVHELAAAL